MSRWGRVGASGDPVGESENHHGDFLRAVETAESTTNELYNLDDDLSESRDLAAAHPEVYRDLKERYVEWLRQFAPADNETFPSQRISMRTTSALLPVL